MLWGGPEVSVGSHCQECPEWERGSQTADLGVQGGAAGAGQQVGQAPCSSHQPLPAGTQIQRRTGSRSSKPGPGMSLCQW